MIDKVATDETTDPERFGCKVTRAAVTTLAVVITIYITARLIESVAPALISCGVIAAAAYTACLIIRHKRNRW